MEKYLYIALFAPLVSSLFVALFAARPKMLFTGIVASMLIALSMVASFILLIDVNTYGPLHVTMMDWISAGNLAIPFGFVVDEVSVIMMVTVTLVSTIVHIYSIGYMDHDKSFNRFFSYLSAFVFSMMILVMSDNFVGLFIGWEGVGLCSWLLIGFWYHKHSASWAANEAFIMNRIADLGMLMGLFLIYWNVGSFQYDDVFASVQELEPAIVVTIGVFLFIGAMGKSAQFPLHTWLADAMAGPTPVSALIHAATMVTAGVYLIARTHGLFLMTPEVLHLVGIVGAVTLLLAGFAALVQTDIKRVLAYSTMSQIGYMFLALGVQAWDAAIFHLMTHAFFKALLFLASGSVILACHHEQNIFKMGGLRKSIPLVYLCFLVGGAALSALPLVTAGFFSKDEILAGAMANGHINLMVAGLVGAFMTSLYTFRMIFIVFHGKEQIHAHAVKGVTHSLPLIVLLILSTFVGALIVPPLQGVLPQTTELAHGSMLTLEITSGVVAVVGILLAAWLWLGKRTLVTSIANSAPGRLLGTWWYNAWGFDWLYDKVFVKPFLGIAWLLKRDPLNSMMNIPAVLSRFAGKGLLLSENGYLRWYVASMSIGAVVVLALLMVLR